MSELQAYYDEFRRGLWATSDPEECRCYGRGWALSEVDTWHRCPVHFEGQLHPEESDGFEDEDEFLAAEEASKARFVEYQAARKAGTYTGGFDTFRTAGELARAAAEREAERVAYEATVGDDEIPF